MHMDNAAYMCPVGLHYTICGCKGIQTYIWSYMHKLQTSLSDNMYI